MSKKKRDKVGAGGNHCMPLLFLACFKLPGDQADQNKRIYSKCIWTLIPTLWSAGPQLATARTLLLHLLNQQELGAAIYKYMIYNIWIYEHQTKSTNMAEGVILFVTSVNAMVEAFADSKSKQSRRSSPSVRSRDEGRHVLGSVRFDMFWHDILWKVFCHGILDNCT